MRNQMRCGMWTVLVAPALASAADTIHFEQGILHALAEGALRGAGAGLEFVDFINEPDARPGARQVASGTVNQPLQNGLDLGIDVARLRERCSIGSHKGHPARATAFRTSGFSRCWPD